MDYIFGLDIVTASILIAISGTVLHQARTYSGKSLPKILDGIMITIGSSFVATHIILSELTITDPFQQTLLILSLVGFTVPGAALGQKTFSKIKQKVKTTQTVDIKDESLIVGSGNNSSRQKISSITNPKIPTSSKQIIKKLSPPELDLKDFWCQNNFKKSENKNSLQYGQVHLWIRIKDVRSYVTVILKDVNGIALQIDQSHELDEDNNIETTRLELLKADGTPFPKGIYYLQMQGNRGTVDSQGIKNDIFEIV